MMYNIAIIGVGSLGKRHLESVLKSDLSMQIYVVDSNKETINDILESSGNIVIGGQDCSILPAEIDVAIISTSSKVRRYVFEEMLCKSKVRMIIFEKVLFQRREDYYAVEKLLYEKKIKAWVNCVRREQPSYIKLKKYMDNSKFFTLNLTGGNWGLACNAIHILDLIQYLNGESQYECWNQGINILPIIEESKRKGYKEIYGSIFGHCGKCLSFSITCLRDSELPVRIEIASNNFRIIIMEDKQKILCMNEHNNWSEKEIDFPLYYQSQITQYTVESIIKTGDCNLPKYKEAMDLHLRYIELIIKFFEEQGLEEGVCPIT